MTSNLMELSCTKFFNGYQYRFQHFSYTNNWPMKFTVFLPAKSVKGQLCPAMIWLTGKTLGEFGFTNKSGFQRFASKHEMIVIAPEPTPRGIEDPLPDGSYEYGAQLGSYVDSITPKWRDHYQMYSYITKELYEIIVTKFPVDREKICISGHSMGGTGVIPIALRNPDKFASLTALSGNYNPSVSEDGSKQLNLYLGPNKELWKNYDATEVIKSYRGPSRSILVDQGGGDSVVWNNFSQSPFLTACHGKNISLIYRVHAHYHHAYEFIQTFVEDHIKFHLAQLKKRR